MYQRFIGDEFRNKILKKKFAKFFPLERKKLFRTKKLKLLKKFRKCVLLKSKIQAGHLISKSFRCKYCQQSDSCETQLETVFGKTLRHNWFTLNGLEWIRAERYRQKIFEPIFYQSVLNGRLWLRTKSFEVNSSLSVSSFVEAVWAVKFCSVDPMVLGSNPTWRVGASVHFLSSIWSCFEGIKVFKLLDNLHEVFAKTCEWF